MMDINDKYAQYDIYDWSQGASSNSKIREAISSKELYDWLKSNKYNLFGYYISRTHGIQTWSANDFYRHETNLLMVAR